MKILLNKERKFKERALTPCREPASMRGTSQGKIGVIDRIRG